MSGEPPIYEQRGYGSFWDAAPESRAARQKAAKAAPTPEPEPNPELEALRLRAETAEAAIAEAKDAGLSRVAYEFGDFSDLATAAAFADELLVSGGPERLAAYMQNWQEAAPAAAAAWADDRQRVVRNLLANREAEEVQRHQAAEWAKRESIVADWLREHDDPAGQYLASEAVTADVSTEELAFSLNSVHTGLRAADRAKLAAEREREIRNAFRQPTPADIFHGRPAREPLPEVSADDVASRMVFDLPGERESRKAAAQQSFREGFAEASVSPFGKGMRELQEESSLRQADEFDRRAAELRKARQQ